MKMKNQKNKKKNFNLNFCSWIGEQDIFRNVDYLHKAYEYTEEDVTSVIQFSSNSSCQVSNLANLSSKIALLIWSEATDMNCTTHSEVLSQLVNLENLKVVMISSIHIEFQQDGYIPLLQKNEPFGDVLTNPIYDKLYVTIVSLDFALNTTWRTHEITVTDG